MIAGRDVLGAVLTSPAQFVPGQRNAAAEHRPGVPGTLVIQGPGGTGKTVLVRELASAYRGAGITVVDAGDAPDPSEVIGELAVLVDDAHQLTDEISGRLHRLVRRPGTRAVVAFRPWPRPAALSRLVDALGSDRRSVVLGHVDRDLVDGWARRQLGDDATAELVDVVLHTTGGLPGLVHPLLEAFAAQGDFRPTAVAGSPGRGGARWAVPDVMTDRVRTALADIGSQAVAVLFAAAVGAPVDVDVLAPLLRVSEERATELVTHARATGLLLDSGDVVPLVQDVLLETTPPDVVRTTRRKLLGLLLDRGDDPLDLARRLARDNVRDPRAARLLERHASAALTADPALAGELLEDAAASGAPSAGLAARRALAAALEGDFDGALQWADEVLADEAIPDRSRAAGVTAAVLAHRGLQARSAELYRMAGPARAGSTALSLVAIGASEPAAAVLDSADASSALPHASAVAGSEALMARGILRSLRSGPDAGADSSASLSTLARAATLLEPVGRTALLSDTPAALAALVALHSGELGVAESVLERALAADVGGPPGRSRHLLLLAWVTMLRGQVQRARECIERASAAAHDGLEPRDELFHLALLVGLARRAGDASALATAWNRAREALLRYPVDLFTLLPLGELVVAGARLREGDRLTPHVSAAQEILRRLGHPQLWATPLHWSSAQAAILNDDPAALRPHAAALITAARTSPYAATLARAGRCWLQVLTGDIDAAVVETAACDLAAMGLSWDGSRLAGQAAARTDDPRARTSLLACARALTEGGGADESPATPTAGTVTLVPLVRVLSDREREVARLVLEGRTYREIGGMLFISAKTVEHHMSRMRQRLGASSRPDLLARLRAEVGEGS